MKITRAEFKISAAVPKQFPADGLPEVAFAGRSNVGKSSLLNSLVRRKNLARVSQTPGKTQLINFFLINNCFYFVDLPGYGFARVSKQMKAQWGKLIESYLQKRETLMGVVQLVDLRHPPSAEDCQMFAGLQALEIPVIIVATKADKISRGNRRKHVKEILEVFNLPPTFPLVCHSAKTGEGQGELLDILGQLLG
ncbi:MAG: ribosome biogenesis GTP-binding protein YihA/YsxC [bacterium]|jgi:GTP-binding protein